MLLMIYGRIHFSSGCYCEKWIISPIVDHREAQCTASWLILPNHGHNCILKDLMIYRPAY